MVTRHQLISLVWIEFIFLCSIKNLSLHDFNCLWSPSKFKNDFVLFKDACPFLFELCTKYKSLAISGSILTKPHGFKKGQIYERESAMEEFPPDYFRVSLKNCWNRAFGQNSHLKASIHWAFIWKAAQGINVNYCLIIVSEQILPTMLKTRLWKMPIRHDICPKFYITRFSG